MEIEFEGKPADFEPAKAYLIRNLLWMAWSGAVSTLSGILLWIFFARLRDVDEVGRFTIVMGLYALFATVSTMGLGAYITSEVSRSVESSRDFINQATGFLALAGFGTACLMTGAGFIVSESVEVRTAIAVLSLAMIPTAMITAAESVAIAFGRTRLIAVSTTIENALRMIVPLLMLWAGFGVVSICASFLLIRLVALAVYLGPARDLGVTPLIEERGIRKLLKVMPTFAGTVILAALNWQAALILLAYFGSAAESAKFGVASRFLIPVTILMASYANVIQPAITRLSERSSGWYISKMASYPLIIAAVAAGISPFLSETVLSFLFGAQYADVGPTLNVLALSVLPFSLVMVVSRGLIATKSQHVDLLANALGVASCFVAGIWLVPQFGAKGAALSQLISFSLIALVEVSYLSQKLNGLRILKAAAMVGVVSLFVSIIYLESLAR
jgi:PST family polysaccharide transporter